MKKKSEIRYGESNKSQIVIMGIFILKTELTTLMVIIHRAKQISEKQNLFYWKSFRNKCLHFFLQPAHWCKTIYYCSWSHQKCKIDTLKAFMLILCDRVPGIWRWQESFCFSANQPGHEGSFVEHPQMYINILWLLFIM